MKLTLRILILLLLTNACSEKLQVTKNGTYGGGHGQLRLWLALTV